MKKILIFSILICFLGAHSGFSQRSISRYWEGFKFGLKAGVNFSNVYDTQGDQFTADGKLGFAGGVFLEVPLSDYLGIRPEILYSQKGFKATGQYLSVPYTFTRSSDYIDVPVLITLKPVPMFSINFGPQFSFLTKQTDVFSSTILTSEQQQAFSNDNYRKNLMSITAGVALDLGKVVLDVRANYDLQKNNGDGTSTTPRYKNAWYQATLGFRII
jgi:hypothetical protein